MNILFEISTINYQICHNMAKRLKHYYPDARFAGIVGIAAGGEHVLDYLNNQGDIKYEFLRIKHELRAEAFKSDIDHKVLREFEEKLPGKSLWRLIASDREWGYAFMHGVIWNKSFINQNNTRENILRIFSGTLKAYRDIFNEFEVDLFLPAICMGGISVHIYEQLCRERGIPYIVPTSVRVKNIFSFSSDVLLRFPQIDETYKKLEQGKITLDYLKAEQLYYELMSELEDPQYFDRQLPCFNITKLDSFSTKTRLFLATGKGVLDTIWIWRKQKELHRKKDMRRQPYKLSILWNNIVNVLKRQYQKARILSPGFGKDLEPGQKYIYYPLHTSPEYSTNFQGTMWMDQLYTIELLAKSIPFDWVVYVKEHPAILSARVRPLDFYKRIMRIPNVRMAPIEADSHKLIINAEMIAAVTGTSGWEAVQRGKPLITFADNFWDVLGLSRKCSDIENLSRDIYDEMKRIADISAEERKKRIIRFLAAAIERGFNISHPQQFCYEESTDEQYEIVGKEAADALKKHLDYLREDVQV